MAQKAAGTPAAACCCSACLFSLPPRLANNCTAHAPTLHTPYQPHTLVPVPNSTQAQYPSTVPTQRCCLTGCKVTWPLTFCRSARDTSMTRPFRPSEAICTTQEDTQHSTALSDLALPSGARAQFQYQLLRCCDPLRCKPIAQLWLASLAVLHARVPQRLQ